MSSRPTPVPLKTNLTETSTVMETPDIAAFRAYDPTANISTISPTIQATFDRQRRDQQANYAYSGITNPVMRTRMQNDEMARTNYDQSTATAELFDAAERRRMEQLGTLANLTAGRQNTKIGTQDALPGQSGNGAAAIGAAGSIGAATITAIAM